MLPLAGGWRGALDGFQGGVASQDLSIFTSLDCFYMEALFHGLPCNCFPKEHQDRGIVPAN